MSEVITGTPEIDPANGYQLVWRSKLKTMNYYSYSMVEVPIEKPISINYIKAFENLRFSFTPLLYPDQFQKCHLSGFIDNDIIQLLSFPVTKKRDRELPPVVSGIDIQEIRKYGIVDSIQIDNKTIYSVNLEFDLHRVQQFLIDIWHPGESDRPSINISGELSNYRIIPQKNINDTIVFVSNKK